MALRRGLAGLVPRLLQGGEAWAPAICSSSSNLLAAADAGPSSSGSGFEGHSSFLRGA
jgi:hypothetical protein